jgi:hypothetical protein
MTKTRTPGPKRTRAELWTDIPPEDTAPDAPRVDVEAWVVPIDQASDHLARQMCPVCGEGPWKSPLNHAARKHGIDRFTMRDVCGLTMRTSVVDPALSAVFAERGKAMPPASNPGPRKKQRWTTAGRAKNAEALTAWEGAHPEDARVNRSRAGVKGAAARWGP